MVYFYSRVAKFSTVPRLLRLQAARKDCKESEIPQAEVGQQVTVVLSPRSQGGADEKFLCDPCFLDAIQTALLKAADFEKYIIQLFLSQRSMITRAHALKLLSSKQH